MYIITAKQLAKHAERRQALQTPCLMLMKRQKHELSTTFKQNVKVQHPEQLKEPSTNLFSTSRS